MKKFLKIIFSRMTLVILAIILQIVLSILLPYLINRYFPLSFSNVFIPIDIIFNALGILLLIRIINSDMNVEGQLSWAVILLAFPLLGLLIYFLFVRRHPPKRHKILYKRVADEITQYQNKTKEEDEKLKQNLGRFYGQFQYIYSATGNKTSSRTKVKYLRQGEIFCAELLEEINRAQKYIFMEYFIIEQGKMWNTILHVLKKKVQQGIEVRLMYDDLGTINKLPANFNKKMEKLGIKCVKFNSFVPIMSAVHNNRDHRKMTISDGKVGFISGLNLADEYVNLKQPYGHWKDTALKLTGEAVNSMLLMFLQLYEVQNLKFESFSNYIYQGNFDEEEGYVCPYGDGPKYFYKEYVAENVYLNIINQAQKYLWITTPYLIIDNKLTTALTNAARRGVDVRIVTPHVPDKKTIFSITRSSYSQLQKAGIKIFEYEKGFIHAKQILCDDEIAILGTINFDYRSLLHHYECGVLMCKTPCLKEMKTDFEHLFNVSIDMKDFKQNALVRLFCAIVKIFTPML